MSGERSEEQAQHLRQIEEVSHNLASDHQSEVGLTPAEIVGLGFTEMEAAVQLRFVPLEVFSVEQRRAFLERYPDGDPGEVTTERALAAKALLETLLGRHA